MSTLVIINTAFPLPAPDIEALLQGHSIVVMPRIFMNPGRQFALYPTDTSINALPTEQYYRSNFLNTARHTLEEIEDDTVLIKAWARCEHCQVIDRPDYLNLLSQLTVWTKEALLKTLAQRGHIFLAYLRVYRLPQPLEIPVHPHPRFIPLPETLTITEETPVFGNLFFKQRCLQMQQRQSSPYPELKALQSAIASLSDRNFAAKEIQQEIANFLIGFSARPLKSIDSDLLWIEKIAQVANSPDPKDFQLLLEKSFRKLGFTNSPTNQGEETEITEEGINLYFDAPYPLVVTSPPIWKINGVTPTVEEVIEGVNKIIAKEDKPCVKLIVTPSKLTPDEILEAKLSQMNVIHPETLQRLVELQAYHKGSIDLIKLQNSWQNVWGSADETIQQYLADIRHILELRSLIVQLVKHHLHNAGLKDIAVDALHRVYITSNFPELLTIEEFHEILIELSSPLTGYLGRIKGKDWQSDRFYFLRDLPAMS
ncbi:MAG TPA: DUF1802 domain-containing protein [Cyanobacteria bacterium UBA11149]|nr:DUF1802 domain-containing protein [Cyanobacteria bacterium UBA11367]HBE59308.1 DUF1802 domain-containing protein [Cyanobacteria bacterium UBA11366]HBK63697.1 DUF1802 domain-containing protein [Cyanobacteria bacterium UBA11166]HBR75750.1 DUF1802 domain-containing protein [Cyanobacteria bacterium UBA11159]HBS70937.1 DUF1802 domain-containing protein [Cyanobacteria bacterium UBA11153]HBW89424.1 DUF1802 domain-containing protein [Cyanobacteria bacterium UBA11149]HCA96839.1 DUF1802 domain-conta